MVADTLTGTGEWGLSTLIITATRLILTLPLDGDLIVEEVPWAACSNLGPIVRLGVVDVNNLYSSALWEHP